MEDGDVQLMVNEYFVNNALWAVFYAGDVLNISRLDFPLTTTVINIGLLGDLAKHGFENDCKCTLAVYADPNGTPPIIKFRNSPTIPFEIEAQLWIALHCAKNKDS